MRLRNHRLLSEVHTLAGTYHWGLGEILSLSLPRRGAFLGLIDAERDRDLLAALA